MTALQPSAYRRFLMVAGTQVSFSATSVLAVLILSSNRESAKADLAFMTGLLLFQGLVRIVIGLNLRLEEGRNDGATLLALPIILASGIAFTSIGYWWWCLASLSATLYEVSRTTLTRLGSGRDCTRVIAMDTAWIAPIAILASTSDLHIGFLLGLGSTSSAVIASLNPTARKVIVESVTPRPTWISRERVKIARSTLEGISGIVVPFTCVALLTAFLRFDDVNSLRSAGQVLSPQGSLVGVFVLTWPSLPERHRGAASWILILAPAAVPMIAAALPAAFAALSADSTKNMTYALGWAAFGTSQTSVVLRNAEFRLNGRARFPPKLGVSAWSAALLAAALVLTDSIPTAATLVAVVGVPLIVSTVSSPRNRRQEM